MLSPSSDAASPLSETPGDEFYVVPASFAQQRLWLLDCLSPGLASYNVPLGLRLSGPLDAAALAGALAALTDRHEALRTALVSEDGEVVQIIAPRLALGLPRIDLQALGTGAEAAAHEIVRRESARPFDLGHPPLARVLLLRLAPDEHVLFLNLHHAISDAWSLGILVRELLDLYEAALGRRHACLPDLPIQFADFAAWQREWLQGQVLEHKLQAWKRLLAGAPAELDLPTDRPRTPAAEQAGRILPFALPEAEAAVLSAFAREAEATLFMALLATFQAVLCRYTGREDLVVGSPVANRGRSETEGVVGFFVNILPLRADLSGRPGFRELLRRVRAYAVESYAHEDLPFEKLVEELRPERRLDQNPIFQVAFALQPPAMAEDSRAGLRLRLIEAHSGTAKFELSLHVMQEGAGLRGFWEYRTDLFDDTTVARINCHWRSLLAGLATRPDRPFTDLPLLAPAERHQLAVEWNEADAVFPREAGIPRLFTERAALHPGAAAVVDGGSTLSYGELDRRSDLLAYRLLELGVRRGDRVGVLLERDGGLVVALLGILKSGAAYLPLDLAYPAERLAWMLADGRVEVLVSRRSLLERLPWPAARALFLEDLEAAGETVGGLPETDGDDLAYILYTSGSTGVPKGVCVSHRAVVRLVRDTDYVRIAPDDVVAQASNASFDAATFEIWGALLNGAQLLIVPREVLLSPEELARDISGRGITTLFLTTALFNRMAAEVPGCFRPLRHLLFGGEAVDPARAAAVLAAGSPQRLLHVYGPTEATTFTTWHAVREVAPGPRTVPIGRPLANARIDVLDAHLHAVPIGVPGEIYIGGEGLARGYLDRPDLTAERFVPDPSAAPGERLYRTGDLARRNRAGDLEFLGRVDHQVKIRGFRIEPAEVEAALRTHAAVGECAVVARPGPSGELGLIAYTVPHAGAAPSSRELRSFLQDRLPDYMVPAAFMVLPRLPQTPNGKVDRTALPEPLLEAEPGGLEVPRGPVEEVLAGIWAEVLRIERVGAHDNFFDLGGHSLTATLVTSHVRVTFRVGLPTRAIFEAPVLRDLAERIADLQRTEQGLELPPIAPAPRDRNLPLSFAQQRLWFLDQLGRGETPFYNVAASLRLGGPLDARFLAQALGEVERRHEALRTTFRTGEEGRAVQVFHAPRPFFLPVVDISELPDAAREKEASRLAREEAARHFSLADGPLFRAGLLRLAPDRHVLSFALHHIVCDGWSLEILMREVAVLYRALLAGAPSPLPELPIQYADYAHWQRQWLSGSVLETQLGYWRQHLQDAPLVLELPTDRPRPALQTYRGRRLSLSLDADLLERLQILVREHRTTLFMAVLAAFGAVLHRRTGQASLIVGTPIANRNRSEIEDLIGFFVNSLALRVDLGGDPTLAELLERVRETALGGYAHQDLPFERLVEELQPERDLSRNPVFQVSLSSHSTPWASLDLPGLSLGFLDLGEAAELFDLSLQFMESMHGLELGLSYNPDLFDAPTVRRLGLHLERVLAALVADPQQAAVSVPLLSEAESHQLLREWSTGPADLPDPGAVAPLFEAWTQRTPEAPALVWPGGGSSYGALNHEANLLAGRLLAAGAGAERVIALGLERPRDFAVAILAVLKTGAAFLPLDPQLPQERRRWMLEDSGTTLVVDRLEESARRAGSLPRPAPLAEALAYVIYTSGSTGVPKGVMVSQGTLAAHCLAMAQRLRLGPGDRLLQSASFSFDLSLEELLCPLVSGAAVVIGIERGATAAELARHLVELRVTAAELSTAYWHDMTREWAAGKGNLAGHSLKVMGIGGEAAPSGALHLWRQTPFGEVPLQNGYGPTEATVTATLHEAVPGGDDRDLHTLPIGRPVGRCAAYVLDPRGEPVPAGLPGELHLGGPELARGYLGRTDLTAGSFVPDPYGSVPGSRLYRTGDLARFRHDGSLEFLGRRDRQLKLRGFRIEPGEVEAALLGHPQVREAAVELREGKDGAPVRHLVAWVAGEEGQAPPTAELRSWLSERLPAYMVPAVFLELPALPRSSAGKLDRTALPAPSRSAEPGAAEEATSLERRVADLWCELLGLDEVGLHDNFFDLGGHSLLMTLLRARLQEQLGIDLSMVDMFEHPTVRALAGRLEQELERTAAARVPEAAPSEKAAAATPGDDYGMGVAIIGMSGRFPGARDVEQLWRNLRAGVESIMFFEERFAEGHSASAGHRVAAGGVLDEVAGWDAAFFGVSPREAEMMDPQHRLFLECAWEALEDAGYDPERYPGAIGVWGGASKSNYVALLAEAGAISDPVSNHFAGLGNDKDYLTTRASYKLDLRGPSVNVQTACSTSLVAVHLACQSLLAGECDMALAGGASVNGQQRAGYFYQPGGVLSPDGRCRAFDAQAAGTVDSDGVGLVVLKRLADALRDGDRVRAVIRGSALNNDGAGKVGFNAPRTGAQAQVIRAALDRAGVSADSLSYVEAHGTATALGDPIEISALAEAFLPDTDRRGFCAIGSVKTNIGHVNGAAGVAGLIKTVLALEHRELPPSLHFERPNPAIDFASSPFFVCSQRRAWTADRGPRRAGVSSFGVGGTNVHVVVEEAPEPLPAGPASCWQLLPLTARTESALGAATAELARHLEEHPELPLADVAWTLQVGRKAFSHRRIVLCRNVREALAGVKGTAPERTFAGVCERRDPPVAFLFPGQGAQYAGMGRGLYREEPVFRQELDRCLDLLCSLLDGDLRAALFPEEPPRDPRPLDRTELAQPALFAVEYALARTWMAWGVQPQALLGHSVGEYVAACLAGVMSLPDALALIAARGRLIQSLPPGSMLAIPLPSEQVEPLLGEELSMAAVNGPSRCVVSGPSAAVAALEARLGQRGIASRRLATSHAFHSAMMEPVLEAFAAEVDRCELRPPSIPLLSNLTGTWARPGEMTDPSYWVRHLRGSVRFADSLAELAGGSRMLLEVGPGRTLAGEARRASQTVLPSLPAAGEAVEEVELFRLTCGRLWLAGVAVDWRSLHSGERRHRMALPAYPFERKPYWAAARSAKSPGVPRREPVRRQPEDWYYVPFWKPSAPPVGNRLGTRRRLLLLDASGLGARLASRLAAAGGEVTTVVPGSGFARRDGHAYVIHPGRREDYDALLADLGARGELPEEIGHLWSYGGGAGANGETPFYSLLFLAQAWAAAGASQPVRITAVVSGLHAVVDGEEVEPLKALLLGPCRVIPQELAGVSCRCVDLEPPEAADPDEVAGHLLRELDAENSEPEAAWRRGRRWVQDLEPVRFAQPPALPARLRPGAVVLVTGGLGGIGLALANHLFERARARLVLVGRSALPARSDWDLWLRSHPADDAVSRRLRRLQDLEERGAEILVLSADVTVREGMDEVRRRAEERFGAVHGIVHAAGVPGGGVLEWKRPEEAARVLAPKVQGTLMLEQAFRGAPLDFLVLCSSQTSLLGGLGQVDYCAANAFLDAFAQARSARGGGLTVAIGWDAWREAGMAVETAAPAALQPGREASLATALSSAEGVDALFRILDQRSPHVIVSTCDFAEHRRASRSPASRRAAAPPRRPEISVPPALSPGADPGGSPMEREIARIWQELLGLPRVGLSESFFELGGDSLIALGVASRLRERYGVELPLARFLENPSVAALARAVEGALASMAPDRAGGMPSTVVPLLAGNGGARPFFAVHPLGGNVLCYQGLSRHLGQRPVYGLQAPGLEGPERPSYVRLEELAAHHLEAMRQVQPSGPYLLGGFSMGGAVAWEIARMLVRDGEKIGLLALMDTYAPAGNGFDDLRLFLWKAATLQIEVSPEELTRRTSPEERLAFLVEAVVSRGTAAGLEPDRIRRLLQVEISNLRAFLGYRPQAAELPLVFFRCTELRKSPEDELPLDRAGGVAVWRELAGAPVDIYEIAAPHDVLMDEPWVGIVGQHLRVHLEKADAEFMSI